MWKSFDENSGLVRPRSGENHSRYEEIFLSDIKVENENIEDEESHGIYVANTTDSLITDIKIEQNLLIDEYNDDEECEINGIKIKAEIDYDEKPFIVKAKPKNSSQRKSSNKSLIGEKPFHCMLCSLAFPRKDYLERHIRRHTGEKPYKCPNCPKVFNDTTGLRRHEKAHNGNKPYSCKICLKAFTQRGHLNAHTKIHTGEKPFTCQICSKCFRYKSVLCVHLRTHTGEKPYECHICAETFGDKSLQRRHIKKHFGESKYVCFVCSESFLYKSDIRKHVKIHSSN